MDDQHEEIKGYRDLTQDEISLMNDVKEKADEVSELISRLEKDQYMSYLFDHKPRYEHKKIAPTHCDKRWVAIGKTDLQKGFMALIRSIAKPESF